MCITAAICEWMDRWMDGWMMFKYWNKMCIVCAAGGWMKWCGFLLEINHCSVSKCYRASAEQRRREMGGMRLEMIENARVSCYLYSVHVVQFVPYTYTAHMTHAYFHFKMHICVLSYMYYIYELYLKYKTRSKYIAR